MGEAEAECRAISKVSLDPAQTGISAAADKILSAEVQKKKASMMRLPPELAQKMRKLEALRSYQAFCFSTWHSLSQEKKNAWISLQSIYCSFSTQQKYLLSRARLSGFPRLLQEKEMQAYRMLARRRRESGLTTWIAGSSSNNLMVSVSLNLHIYIYVSKTRRRTALAWKEEDGEEEESSQQGGGV